MNNTKKPELVILENLNAYNTCLHAHLPLNFDKHPFLHTCTNIMPHQNVSDKYLLLSCS